jgi:hypothetical protein
MERLIVTNLKKEKKIARKLLDRDGVFLIICIYYLATIIEKCIWMLDQCGGTDLYFGTRKASRFLEHLDCVLCVLDLLPPPPHRS